MLQDMAILTGGQVISEEVGLKLENTTLDLLGRARKVVITKDNTTIVEGGGAEDDVKGRIGQIKREIDDTDSDWDREKLQERLAKLAGGVAVVKVGAATEVELKEKKHRIEDALSATRAAIEEGVVAGGGTALLRARAAVADVVASLDGDEATGARAVLRGARARPGSSPRTPASRVRSSCEQVERETGSIGLNAATGEFEDLLKAGVIDPAKVTRAALQNAASIAGLLLTTEVPRRRQAREEVRHAGRCRRHGRHGWHGWHGRDDVIRLTSLIAAAARASCPGRGASAVGSMASWPLQPGAPGCRSGSTRWWSTCSACSCSRRRSRPSRPVMPGPARAGGHPAGGHGRRPGGGVPPRAPAAAPGARPGDGGRHRAWWPSCSATTWARPGCVFVDARRGRRSLGLLLRTDYRPKRAPRPGRAWRPRPCRRRSDAPRAAGQPRRPRLEGRARTSRAAGRVVGLGARACATAGHGGEPPRLASGSGS